MKTQAHLYMVSFDGVPDHWMDGGFVPLETLFLAAKDERGARLIAVANDRHLDVDSDMKIVDLGVTDNRLGFCTDSWDILTPEHYALIFDADGIPHALDALCYDTTPAPDDDPRSWTGVA